MILADKTRSPAARPTPFIRPSTAGKRTLAHVMGLHASQIKKYELGTAGSALDALSKLVQVLQVSLNALVIEEAERRREEDLCFHLEAVSNMPLEDNEALLEGMIVKQRVRHLFEGIGG